MSFCSINEQTTSTLSQISKNIPRNRLIRPCNKFILEKLKQMSLDISSSRIYLQSNYNSTSKDQIKMLERMATVHKWCKIEELDILDFETVDDTIRFLSRKITKHFSDLQRFRYGMTWDSKLTDQGVERFGSAIARNLGQLCQLQIRFRLYTDQDTQGFKSFVSEITRHLTRLQRLDLAFQYCRFTEEDMKVFGSKIARYLPQLDQLFLSFAGSSITDKGVELLGLKIAKGLKTLTQLGLNFSDCREIKNNSLSCAFSDVINKLPDLVHLNLDFSGTCITDEGMETLKSKGAWNLPKLKQLDLEFKTTLTAKGIKILISEVTTYLPQLHQFNLKITECKGLIHEDLKIIGSQIAEGLNQLHVLAFRFDWCSDITDKSVMAFASLIAQSLPQLRQLDVQFFLCNSLTLSGISNIESEILTQRPDIFLNLTLQNGG